MKKKILIIVYSIHDECIGGFCELLKKHNITLLINKKTDRWGWISFWKKYYKFNLLLENDYSSEKNFECVINLTSYLENTKNINIDINIHHSTYDLLENINYKNITITPFTNVDIPYLLPISNINYNYKSVEYCFKNKKIVFVGRFEERYLDNDTIEFIKNTDFNFTFFLRTNTRKIPSVLNNINNVDLITNVSAEKLINEINNATYILCRKYPFQKKKTISGAVHIGISFNKILLLQSEMNSKYNIPSINFNKKYKELISVINSISLNEYIKLYKQVLICKQNIINKNLDIMNTSI